MGDIQDMMKQILEHKDCNCSRCQKEKNETSKHLWESLQEANEKIANPDKIIFKQVFFDPATKGLFLFLGYFGTDKAMLSGGCEEYTDVQDFRKTYSCSVKYFKTFIMVDAHSTSILETDSAGRIMVKARNDGNGVSWNISCSEELDWLGHKEPEEIQSLFEQE